MINNLELLEMFLVKQRLYEFLNNIKGLEEI